MALSVNVGDMVVVDFGFGGDMADNQTKSKAPRLLLSAEVIEPNFTRFDNTTAVRWMLEFFHPDRQVKTKMSVYEAPDGSTYPEVRVYDPEDNIKETP